MILSTKINFSRNGKNGSSDNYDPVDYHSPCNDIKEEEEGLEVHIIQIVFDFKQTVLEYNFLFSRS
jgi:hypothetical protein